MEKGLREGRKKGLNVFAGLCGCAQSFLPSLGGGQEGRERGEYNVFARVCAISPPLSRRSKCKLESAKRALRTPHLHNITYGLFFLLFSQLNILLQASISSTFQVIVRLLNLSGNCCF